ILSRLMDLGYDEVDFPQRDPEVNKLEALSDEEWERIRPTVVDAAESTKNGRIAGEAWRRQDQRSQAIYPLWAQIVAVASGTRAVSTAEMAACSDFNEFLTFGPIAALMEADTDGIPAQELEPIRPGALQFVIQRRRRHLVRLRNILNAVPPDHIDEEEWSSLTNEETILKLDTIAAHLIKAVNGFWDSNRKQVEWYPSDSLLAPHADLAGLSPVESLAPGLMAKMLEIIGKDTNADSGVLGSSTYFGQIVHLYHCARCDERVTPYLTFKGMFSHFVEQKVWFDKASEAREKAFTEPSGSKAPAIHSTLFNDHDWNLEEDIMKQYKDQPPPAISSVLLIAKLSLCDFKAMTTVLASQLILDFPAASSSQVYVDEPQAPTHVGKTHALPPEGWSGTGLHIRVQQLSPVATVSAGQGGWGSSNRDSTLKQFAGSKHLL
ncbi:hypothetical protein FRC01_010031, partial [Tulasnella sp. 417]